MVTRSTEPPWVECRICGRRIYAGSMWSHEDGVSEVLCKDCTDQAMDDYQETVDKLNEKIDSLFDNLIEMDDEDLRKIWQNLYDYGRRNE